MGDEHPFDLTLVLLEVGGVGDDVVNPEHAGLRKLQTTVDGHNVVAVFDGIHVLSDFIQSREGDDLQELVALEAMIFLLVAFRFVRRIFLVLRSPLFPLVGR